MSNLKWFCMGVAFVGISLSISTNTYAQKFPAPAVSYVTFQNQKLTVYPWPGKYVALLTLSNKYNRSTMRKIVATFDKAYLYYKRMTGRSPRQRHHYRGRLSIVEVHKTCGAGCGYLGDTGIELPTYSMKKLYQGVHKHNHYDQVVFYELGRNFWFYGPQASTGSVTTGFAVFMRFRSMQAAKVKGGPFGSMSFRKFRSTVKGLLQAYQRGKYTWNNTVGAGKSPGWGGGTDMFASFLMDLSQRYGGDRFIAKFWQALGKLPRKLSDKDAVNNLATAAVVAGGWPAFQQLQKWRWPVSKASVIRKLKGQHPTRRRTSKLLGGINLNQYCQRQHKDPKARAVLLDAQGKVTHNPVGPGMAYRWKCKTRSNLYVGMFLNAACQHQYRTRRAYAKATNPNHAYTWKCYRK